MKGLYSTILERPCNVACPFHIRVRQRCMHSYEIAAAAKTCSSSRMMHSSVAGRMEEEGLDVGERDGYPEGKRERKGN